MIDTNVLRTWAEALRQVLSPSAAQRVIDAADEIDRLSALVQAGSGWIKVEDRLPEIPHGDHAISVLASWPCPCGDEEMCGDWHVSDVTYRKDGKWQSWAISGSGRHIETIVYPAYWRYKPEPPFLSKYQQRRKDSAIAAAGKEST